MMTRSEKIEIYGLLKTASDSLYGFSSPNFPREAPNFLDDAEPAAQAESPENRTQKTAETPAATLPNAQSEDEIRAALEEIAGKAAACTSCPLHSGRTKSVPGTGVLRPLVVVVGEGPGEQEDLSGIPFVGPAGQLLDKMLSAIGLSRGKNCYIANVVKCRPPQNRTPFEEEARACLPFLEAQISLLKPKAILAAGSTALKNMMETKSGVVKLHGQRLNWRGIPLMATYHPSALLHYPQNKRTAWEDLKLFRKLLLELSPGYLDD